MSDLVSAPAWDKTIRTDLNAVAIAGYTAIALIICGFGYWAATAPLSGAAVAPGTIAATSFNRKVIPTIPGADNLIDEQIKEFDARLARFTSETTILRQRVETLHEALSGLTA